MLLPNFTIFQFHLFCPTTKKSSFFLVLAFILSPPQPEVGDHLKLIGHSLQGGVSRLPKKLSFSPSLLGIFLQDENEFQNLAYVFFILGDFS